MSYKYGMKIKKRRSIIKPVLWLLLAVAAVLYTITIMRWWDEGSRNFDWQRWCAQYQNEIDKSQVPSGCLPYYNEGR